MIMSLNSLGAAPCSRARNEVCYTRITRFICFQVRRSRDERWHGWCWRWLQSTSSAGCPTGCSRLSDVWLFQIIKVWLFQIIRSLAVSDHHSSGCSRSSRSTCTRTAGCRCGWGPSINSSPTSATLTAPSIRYSTRWVLTAPTHGGMARRQSDSLRVPQRQLPAHVCPSVRVCDGSWGPSSAEEDWTSSVRGTAGWWSSENTVTVHLNHLQTYLQDLT